MSKYPDPSFFPPGYLKEKVAQEWRLKNLEERVRILRRLKEQVSPERRAADARQEQFEEIQKQYFLALRAARQKKMNHLWERHRNAKTATERRAARMLSIAANDLDKAAIKLDMTKRRNAEERERVWWVTRPSRRHQGGFVIHSQPIEGEYVMSDNLPTVAPQGGEVALAGGASGAGIASALQNLIANLNHKSEVFDGVDVSLHCETKPDGGSRSVFSYRCYKHHRK